MKTPIPGIERHVWKGPPAPNALVYDADRDTTATYQAPAGTGHFWLRPVGGGIEWVADATSVYPDESADHVRELVAQARQAAHAAQWGL